MFSKAEVLLDSIPMAKKWLATLGDYDYDGVICGHIHKAEMRDIDGIKYLNCGDWVESCTAVVETLDGQ